MSKMNFDIIKPDIEKINNIVRTCPESVQEKCFELLFNLRFGQFNVLPVEDQVEAETTNTLRGNSSYKLQGNVKGMLRKNGLSSKDLGKLFLLDNEPILPVYKVDVSKTAKAQVQKVFMILLENALVSGQFKADYSEIRATCKEEGLYDGNFTANLRKQAEFFKGAITKGSIDENGKVELDGLGYARLGEIIKELTPVQ